MRSIFDINCINFSKICEKNDDPIILSCFEDESAIFFPHVKFQEN